MKLYCKFYKDISAEEKGSSGEIELVSFINIPPQLCVTFHVINLPLTQIQVGLETCQSRSTSTYRGLLLVYVARLYTSTTFEASGIAKRSPI